MANRKRRISGRPLFIALPLLLSVSLPAAAALTAAQLSDTTNAATNATRNGIEFANLKAYGSLSSGPQELNLFGWEQYVADFLKNALIDKSRFIPAAELDNYVVAFEAAAHSMAAPQPALNSAIAAFNASVRPSQTPQGWSINYRNLGAIRSAVLSAKGTGAAHLYGRTFDHQDAMIETAKAYVSPLNNAFVQTVLQMPGLTPDKAFDGTKAFILDALDENIPLDSIGTAIAGAAAMASPAIAKAIARAVQQFGGGDILKSFLEELGKRLSPEQLAQIMSNPSAPPPSGGNADAALADAAAGGVTLPKDVACDGSVPVKPGMPPPAPLTPEQWNLLAQICGGGARRPYNYADLLDIPPKRITRTVYLPNPPPPDGLLPPTPPLPPGPSAGPGARTIGGIGPYIGGGLLIGGLIELLTGGGNHNTTSTTSTAP